MKIFNFLLSFAYLPTLDINQLSSTPISVCRTKITENMKIGREKVHQKYCGKCGYCGEEIAIKEMQIDHIVPIYRHHTTAELSAMNVIRGNNDFENLMPSCKSCNNYKKTLTVEKFRIEMQKQVQRLIDYSTNYRFAKKFGLIEETNKPVVFFFEK